MENTQTIMIIMDKKTKLTMASILAIVAGILSAVNGYLSITTNFIEGVILFALGIVFLIVAAVIFKYNQKIKQ
jgi:hypothetical protein